MKIAIVCSNYFSINKKIKKGTEIFDSILINNLVKSGENTSITAFASGDSNLPVPIESIDYQSSVSDKSILKKGKHIIFELALLSKAFSMQDKFDLFHINIGDGDIALPFAPFVKKPILITLHYTQDENYIDKYFSLFKQFKNVSFISVSNAQRKFFPNLNFTQTIYHGIETDLFEFDPEGGEHIMWAGRGVPDKGLDTILKVLPKAKRKMKLFPLRKEGYYEWLDKKVADLKLVTKAEDTVIEFDKDRLSLISEYQSSKLFLFPIQWEEPFGLVLIESLACGTPVVAYAKGSLPEIIKDGETGFLVNSSPEEIRGNWIIKKTGLEGLKEAIKKVYSLSDDEYRKMRQDCRTLVEKSFSANKMSHQYLKVYKNIIGQFSGSSLPNKEAF